MRIDAMQGAVVQGEQPDWEPLLAVVGHQLAPWFTWVFEVELADGVSVHAYKHVATRSYLFIDRHRRAYEDNGSGGYVRRSLPTAITRAFSGWERAAPSDQDAAALRSAVAGARMAS